MTSTSPTLRGIRVLIVEDNFVVADSLRFMLTGYDATVTAVVPSLAHAEAVLARDAVDVAILDIDLTNTNGMPRRRSSSASGTTLVPFRSMSRIATSTASRARTASACARLGTTAVTVAS